MVPSKCFQLSTSALGQKLLGMHSPTGPASSPCPTTASLAFSPSLSPVLSPFISLPCTGQGKPQSKDPFSTPHSPHPVLPYLSLVMSCLSHCQALKWAQGSEGGHAALAHSTQCWEGSGSSHITELWETGTSPGFWNCHFLRTYS